MKGDINFRGSLIDHELARARDVRLSRLIARHHEQQTKAKEYTNLIIVAGYAAFFTLLAAVGADIGPRARCASAVLIAVSLMGFICWEVVGMWLRAQTDAKFDELIAPRIEFPAGFEERWDMAVGEVTVDYHRYRAVWPWVLSFVVVTGLSGAAILAGAALAKVLSA